MRNFVCETLSVSPQKIKVVDFIDIAGGIHGEGYTLMTIDLNEALDYRNLPDLPTQNGWDKFTWDYTTKNSEFYEYLSAGLFSFGGTNKLMNSLEKLRELISEKNLLYGGYGRDMDGSPDAQIYMIDPDENILYYIDYSF